MSGSGVSDGQEWGKHRRLGMEGKHLRWVKRESEERPHPQHLIRELHGSPVPLGSGGACRGDKQEGECSANQGKEGFDSSIPSPVIRIKSGPCLLVHPIH